MFDHTDSAQQEELDVEALRALGKTYSECNHDERYAVEMAVKSHRLVAMMRARGARTVGDLFTTPTTPTEGGTHA